MIKNIFRKLNTYVSSKKLSSLQVMIFGILMICAGVIITINSTNEKNSGYGIITIIGGAYFFLWPVIILSASRKPKDS